jgi:hypothetical protein
MYLAVPNFLECVFLLLGQLMTVKGVVCVLRPLQGNAEKARIPLAKVTATNVCDVNVFIVATSSNLSTMSPNREREKERDERLYSL